MHSRTRVGFLIVALALVGAACSGDGDGESSTTIAAGGTVTSLPDAGSDGGSPTDDTVAETTTTTEAPTDGGASVPTFSIVSREPGDDGDTVVVLLDPESYETLTDIDLQNVLSVVVDDFGPVSSAHIVDSAVVAELVVADPADIDEEGQRLLNLHYLVRLDEGFRITFVGPFSDSGSSTLGS